jgi:hypothetical protein
LKRFQDALGAALALKFTTNDQLDPELISQIQNLVAQCQRSTLAFDHTVPPTVSALWRQALDRATALELRNVRMSMFRAAWRDQYWDLAQQLFARLQKEFPQKPQYHFAWIACSQLQAEALPADSTISVNLKKLAYLSIKAAIDNTVQQKDTPRKLASSFHLRMAVAIYTAQNHTQELLQLFGDQRLTDIAAIGATQIEFIRCRLDSLRLLKRWDLVCDFTYNALLSNLDKRCNIDRPREHAVHAAIAKDEPDTNDVSWADDWHVWQALLDSQNHNGPTHQSSVARIHELIHRALTVSPSNRNAHRALLTWTSKFKRDDLLRCIMFTFNVQSVRQACFGDLKDFVKLLSHEEESKFIQNIDLAAKSRSPWADNDTENSDVDVVSASSPPKKCCSFSWPDRTLTYSETNRI